MFLIKVFEWLAKLFKSDVSDLYEWANSETIISRELKYQHIRIMSLVGSGIKHDPNFKMFQKDFLEWEKKKGKNDSL